MDTIAQRLRERGRVTGGGAALVSPGRAFRERVARRQHRAIYEHRRATHAHFAAQVAADRERAKHLGGRARSEAEEREFLGLLVRHGFSRAYFESRPWEKRASGVAS